MKIKDIRFEQKAASKLASMEKRFTGKTWQKRCYCF